MRVNNINDDLILRYSRTFQAVRAEMSGRFDAVLADASRRTVNAGSDTLITAKAQEVLQARTWTNFGRYDPILAAHRNGEVSCV